jgi:histone-lysine N-methyltransferase EZH2
MHPDPEKPSGRFQLEQGLVKEKSGFWGKEKFSSGEDQSKSDPFAHVEELSSFQKTICKRMYQIYEGDIEKMSMVMRAPKGLIREHVTNERFSLDTPNGNVCREERKNASSFYSLKAYKKKWLKAYCETVQGLRPVVQPFFEPCCHEENCSETTCSCVQNHMFCTAACSWSAESPNFFRGCDCKEGDCSKISCNCWSLRRECDPDLCKCQTCSDMPNQPATKQRCRNDNVRMRRHPQLLLGESTVQGAGFGLFTKDTLKKGDFVGEYVGESISQEEAERRGQIDDARNSSYLFNIASDCVVDSAMKGNCTRFINHSHDNANVEPKSKSNGLPRLVAFFR